MTTPPIKQTANSSAATLAARMDHDDAATRFWNLKNYGIASARELRIAEAVAEMALWRLTACQAADELQAATERHAAALAAVNSH